jgi:hypothetical protein
MKFLKYPLTLLYRIWFYILVFVQIIVLFPFIFATILSEKTYPLFFKIARLWSKIILIGMGFNYSIEGDESTQSHAMTLEYGDGNNPPDPLLRTSAIGSQHDMSTDINQTLRTGLSGGL